MLASWKTLVASPLLPPWLSVWMVKGAEPATPSVELAWATTVPAQAEVKVTENVPFASVVPVKGPVGDGQAVRVRGRG